jgi:hypothetical protein
MSSDFYVGYLATPTGLKRTLGRLTCGLLVVGAAVAGLLVVGQSPFPQADFEFGQNRDFHGVLIAQPAPALVIAGQGLPWLLAARGKHGLQGVDGLVGHEVELKGQRIRRGADHMIEVQPDSVKGLGPSMRKTETVDLGQARLMGEIVDSKCYFGVMNPGNGKVHRDCAVRCISGGVPPAFLVRDADGQTNVLLLANWKRELLDHVAEPITLQGRLSRSEGRLILRLE